MTAAASLLDRAGAVRAGEELDTASVDAFLKARIDGLQGEPGIRQFARGASNLTYLVSYAGRDLVLRRPPFGHKARGAHDMGREVRVMRALKPVYGVVPTVLAFGDDASVMGCEFYVMERIAGFIPRQDLPPALGLGPQETRRLCLSVIDKLIELHRIDPAKPTPAAPEGAPPSLLALGRGEGFVQRQVEGWSRQLRDARTDDVGDFEPVMAWLARKRPEREAAVRVVHGDYRFDNLVLDPADPCRVVGVLDWEMATLGDPLMDLGNALAYWVQADDDDYFRQTRRQPTDAPGMLTRAEVVAHYAAGTGLPVANFDFYAVFGIFRLAVIVQQIWRRYREGATRDPQFAAFGPMVNYLEQRCAKAIAASAL